MLFSEILNTFNRQITEFNFNQHIIKKKFGGGGGGGEIPGPHTPSL